VSANSNTIVWALSELVSTARSVPYYSSDNGTTWRAASGAPAINVGTGYYWNSPLASDRKTGGTFYLYNNDNGRFDRSTDNGHNFSQVASGLPVDARVFLVANPYVANDLWIVFADEGSLRHSTNGGATWTQVTNVSAAQLLALGKGPNPTTPSIFVKGTVSGVPGLYRSDNRGASWFRVDVARPSLESMVPLFMVGDRQVYGGVFVGGYATVYYGAPISH